MGVNHGPERTEMSSNLSWVYKVAAIPSFNIHAHLYQPQPNVFGLHWRSTRMLFAKITARYIGIYQLIHTTMRCILTFEQQNQPT